MTQPPLEVGSVRGLPYGAFRMAGVDVWVRHLPEELQPVTGRVGLPVPIARRLSCLSKFYGYGIKTLSSRALAPSKKSAGKVSKGAPHRQHFQSLAVLGERALSLDPPHFAGLSSGPGGSLTS